VTTGCLLKKAIATEVARLVWYVLQAVKAIEALLLSRSFQINMQVCSSYVLYLNTFMWLFLTALRFPLKVIQVDLKF